MGWFGQPDFYPENQIWLFAKSLKILSGQPYGIKKNSAIFYPDRDLATKGAFRGPSIVLVWPQFPVEGFQIE